MHDFALNCDNIVPSPLPLHHIKHLVPTYLVNIHKATCGLSMMDQTKYQRLDEKHHEDEAFRSTPRPAHRVERNRIWNRFIPAVLLTSTMLLLFRLAFVCHGKYDAAKNLQEPAAYNDQDDDNVRGQKLALEAHIMSKCPDARDCLQQLVVPTMARVSDKVDFKLSFIGRYDDESDSVACMHGPSECLGNMILLCAAREYPDPKIYLGFTRCLTQDYAQIPDRDFVESCAMDSGMNFALVNRCISDEGHGSELLRDSFIRSHDNNVTKSCTVRLAGKVRCIRDGGKWYDCPGGSEPEDLIRDINELYQA